MNALTDLEHVERAARPRKKRAPFECVVVYQTNPFHPATDRVIKTVRARRTLRALAPKTQLPFVCMVNGEYLLRAEWDRKICNGDMVLFQCYMRGGSGGRGKNWLSIVGVIAISIVAPYAAVAIGGAAAGTVGALTTIGQLIAGGVTFLGSQVLNSVFSRTPSAPAAHVQADISGPSPTYSLQAQGNVARIGGPIPVVYGRHQIFPNFAAQPYTEYANNEQYLYQLFCIGQGAFDIEAIRIEDTPISSLEEVTYEVVEPGGTVTLFPTDVVTSAEVSGQEIIEGETYIGPFVANAAGTVANKLAFDIVFPSGLFYANDEGGLTNIGVYYKIAYQQIDAAGAAIGPWLEPGTFIPHLNTTAYYFEAATNTPQRVSHIVDLATPGRYQVRMLRYGAKNTNSRYGHTIAWAGLRAYMAGTQQYGQVTMLAMKIRASNQLSSQASRKFNVIATRKLPIWNGATWSAPTATRSIAWALADICRASYGGQKSNAQIGLADLLPLATVWDSRGDYFDGVFDTRSVLWEALQVTARAGRAKPFIQGGIIRFARDEAATVPVALFTYRNIVHGTFEAEYLLPTDESPDSVEVKFFDAEVWKENRVRAVLPGGTDLRPGDFSPFGVTDRDHAWRDGMYEAACNRYRRQQFTFDTEMEGFIPSPLDLIAFARDRVEFGQTAEIVAYNAGTREATLTQELEWGVGTHYVGLRTRAGGMSGPYVATPGSTAYSVILGSAPAIPIDIDGTRERTQLSFGPGESYRTRARVIDLKPRSLTRVSISCVIENDTVHTVDGTLPPAAATPWNLTPTVTRPVIAEINVVSGGSPDAPTLFVQWTPARGADYYIVQQSSDGEQWDTVSEQQNTRISIKALRGDNYIRVAAVGLLKGEWVEWAGSSYAGEFLENTPRVGMANVTGLVLAGRGNSTEWLGKDIEATWRKTSTTGAYELGEEVNGAGSGYVDIEWQSYRVDVLLPDGTPLRPSEFPTVNRYTYTLEKHFEDTQRLGIELQRDIVLKVWNVGRWNQLSPTAARLRVTNPQVGLPAAAEIGASFKYIFVNLTPPAGAMDFEEFIVWRSTVDGFTPSGFTMGAGNCVYAGGKNTNIVLAADPGETYYVRYAARDSFGVDGIVISSQVTVTTARLDDDDIGSGIIDESHLYAALGTRIDLIDAAAGVPGSVNARIATEATTRSDADSAIALSVTNLTTTVGGHTTTIGTHASSINGLHAQYTVKIDNNGYVSGFGLASTLVNDVPLSEFIVRADRFVVGDTTGTDIVPFVVVGGVTYIDTANIKNASIQSAQILSLNADKINAGTIAVALELTAATIVLNTTGYIRGGQTAYNTGVGFFLGYSSGAYKLSIGDPSGSYFRWTGANIECSGLLQDTRPYAAGSNTLIMNPTLVQKTGAFSGDKTHAIRVARSGTLTFKFRMRSNNGASTVHAQISKDGTGLVGTLRATTSSSFVSFSEDLACVAGDVFILNATIAGAGVVGEYVDFEVANSFSLGETLYSIN